MKNKIVRLITYAILLLMLLLFAKSKVEQLIEMYNKADLVTNVYQVSLDALTDSYKEFASDSKLLENEEWQAETNLHLDAVFESASDYLYIENISRKYIEIAEQTYFMKVYIDYGIENNDINSMINARYVMLEILNSQEFRN